MRARKLIECAAFDAPTVAVIGEAFDRAWAEIAHNFSDGADHVERARDRLAHAILAVADDESRDPEILKQQALEVMALTFRGRLTDGGQRKH
jgi:hypothetical protein